MKPASFSHTKGCECRAWGFDKTTKDQQWSPTSTEEGEVCLSVCLALFPLALENKKKLEMKKIRNKKM